MCGLPHPADLCRGSQPTAGGSRHRSSCGQALGRCGPEAVPVPVAEVRVGGSRARCGLEAVHHPGGLDGKVHGGWCPACPVPSPTSSGRALSRYGSEAVAGPGVLGIVARAPRFLPLCGLESVPGWVSPRAPVLCGPCVEPDRGVRGQGVLVPPGSHRGCYRGRSWDAIVDVEGVRKDHRHATSWCIHTCKEQKT